MTTEDMLSESRAVTRFDQVALSYPGELTIVQGEPEGVVVEAAADLLPKIITEVRDGILVIELGHDWWERLIAGVLTVGRQVRCTVTMPRVRGIRIGGAGTVTAESITGDELALQTSGSGTVRIDRLSARSLEVSISGRGEYEIAGRVEQQEVEISGTGEYQAGNLISDRARVKVSGQGRAVVHADEVLEIRISGMGTVEYSGSPHVSQSISGVGNVRKLEAPAELSGEDASDS